MPYRQDARQTNRVAARAARLLRYSRQQAFKGETDNITSSPAVSFLAGPLPLRCPSVSKLFTLSYHCVRLKRFARAAISWRRRHLAASMLIVGRSMRFVSR